MSVGGDSLLAVYDGAGALERVRAERNCVFATDDFSGSAPLLDYDVPQEKIVISGKEAAVVSKKNTFASSRFVIQTRSRLLATDQGVKATLVPGKKSVLLKRKPVYVTASVMELSEKGDVTRFKEKVRLFQEEIELHAGELIFESQGNRIGCLGGADMNFLNDNERVALQGKAMTFQPEERTILIEGDARLRQGENMLAARKIELIFAADDKLKDIMATDEAAFSKKDLSGKARLLIWHYSQRTVLFRNSAEITRSRSGTTRGEELLFNLDSNEITVSGEQDRTETTIRRDLP
jgi:lipopolysaccharide transport protein LptA